MNDRVMKSERGHFRLWLIRYLLCLLVVGGLFFYNNRTKSIKVEFELNTTVPSRVQLFYALGDGRFSADRVVDIPVSAENQWQKATAEIKTRKNVQQLRLDPIDGYGAIKLRYFRVIGVGGQKTWSRPDLLNCGLQNFRPVVGSTDAFMELSSTGVDPQIHFDLPSDVTHRSAIGWLQLVAVVNLYSLVLFGFIQVTLLLVSQRVLIVHTVHDFLTKSAELLSDQRVIVFNAGSISVIFIIGILAALFVTFRLNQSSVGVWDNMFGAKGGGDSFRIGSPKDIRSDEWNTQTPWVLNQVQHGMNVDNENIGGAESAFVAATPTRHPVMIAQPKFWGFLFLDLERGFSWVWAYKAFGLFTGFYLLFLLLTKGDGIISVSGSLWVYGSSFVQWWYSSHLPEILIGFAFALVGAIYLLQAGRVWGKLFGGMLIIYAVSNLLLHVYPPFLVPLAYLGGFTVIAFNMQKGRLQNILADWKPLALISLIAFSMIGLLVYSWAVTGHETIELMLNTVYPGKRNELGGDMPLTRLCYGVFEGMRTSQNIFPIAPSNACEASGFALLFPFTLFLVNPNDRKTEEFPLLSGLLLYCLLLLAWMIVPLPIWIRHGFAAMGWSLSPSARSQVGLGIGSIMLVTVLASLRARENAAWGSGRTIGLMVFTALIMLLVGYWLKGIDPEYFDNVKIYAGLLIVEGILLSILLAKRWGFLLSIMVLVLPSLTVNPVQAGLGSLLDKPILNMAVRQGSHVGDRWAVIGSFVFAQGLKARGLDVVNGSNYAPNMSKLRVFDPESSSRRIWNRYAHITIASVPGIAKPEFVLLGPDHYLIKIDICSDQLRRLGVTHLAYTENPPKRDLNCLVPLESDPASGVYLYEYRRDKR